MSDILPCPFCGNEPIKNVITNTLRCASFGCPISDASMRLSEWNTRHAAPVVISEDVDERMDRLHVLAEHFVSTYETMTDSGSRGESEDHFWSAREECMKALSALEAASLPAGGWVKMSDRKPGSHTALFYYPAGESLGSRYAETICGYSEYHGPFQPTHWMPLPSPPKDLKP